jgi:hypothetical protein
VELFLFFSPPNLLFLLMGFFFVVSPLLTQVFFWDLVPFTLPPTTKIHVFVKYKYTSFWKRYRSMVMTILLFVDGEFHLGSTPQVGRGPLFVEPKGYIGTQGHGYSWTPFQSWWVLKDFIKLDFLLLFIESDWENNHSLIMCCTPNNMSWKNFYLCVCWWIL